MVYMLLLYMLLKPHDKNPSPNQGSTHLLTVAYISECRIQFVAVHRVQNNNQNQKREYYIEVQTKK
jgi:hypothetical protein